MLHACQAGAKVAVSCSMKKQKRGAGTSQLVVTVEKVRELLRVDDSRLREAVGGTCKFSHRPTVD